MNKNVSDFMILGLVQKQWTGHIFRGGTYGDICIALYYVYTSFDLYVIFYLLKDTCSN